MSLEVDSISSGDLDLDKWSSCSFPEKKPSFHANIFTQINDRVSLARTVTLLIALMQSEQKVQKVAHDKGIVAMDTNVGGEIEIDIGWGGKDGPSISVSASGNASDDKGNKIEATVTVNDDGSGKASISASHEEKD